MIAVFYGRSYANACKRILNSFLESIDRNTDHRAVFINTLKNSTMLQEVPAEMDFIEFPILNVLKYSKNWNEFDSECEKFLVENNIDKVVMYGSTMVQGFRCGQEKSIVHNLNKMVDRNDYRMNYISVANFFAYVRFIGVCSKVCDMFVHQVIDPFEPDYSKVYDFKEYRSCCEIKLFDRKTTIMPFYERYSFFEGSFGFDNEDRSLDFQFGGTAVTEDREWLSVLVNDIDSIMEKESLVRDVFVQTKKSTATRKMVSQIEYVYGLSDVLSTLTVPAYHKDAFSLCRLVESAGNGCVPLVMKGCNLRSIESIYPELCEVIDDKLICSNAEEVVDNILKLKNGTRKEVVEEIRNSFTSSKVLDIQWLKSRWQKLLKI